MKYTLFLFPLFLLWSCRSAEKETAAEAPAALESTHITLTDAQMKNAHIETGKPALQALNTVLKVNGVVDVPPQNLVSISFPLGGYLKSTDLLPGMKINKGQVIAVMEDQSFIQLQEDYLVAKARLEYTEKEFERQQQLNLTKTSSDKVFGQAQADYQSQKITVSALSEKLRLIGLKPEQLTEKNISRSVNIYSPIDGYVSAVSVNIGKYVNPADVLFELVNPQDIHLALTVYEKDIPLLQVGQKVKARLANRPGKEYDAEIILIGRNLDANRSTTIHCHFENKEHDLLPGMFLNAEIQVTNPASVVVPEEAVVRYENGEYVFVPQGKNTFELLSVKTGIRNNGMVELPEFDTSKTAVLVTKNAYTLLMQMKNSGESE